MIRDLDLAPSGNCAVSALLDRIAGSCGHACRASTATPSFSNLLGADDDREEQWSSEMINSAETSQAYLLLSRPRSSAR